MKRLIFACILAFVAVSCSQDTLVETAGQFSEIERLSSRPSLLRLGYTEVSQRSARFPEGLENNPLTFLEEPKSSRKNVYIEIYDDLTYGMSIEELPTVSDFPVDQFSLPNDMPKIKTTTYLDGVVTGYDASGNVILEDVYENTHWLDINQYGGLEEARRVLLGSYFNPREVAPSIISSVLGTSEAQEEIQQNVVKVKNTITTPDFNTSTRVEVNPTNLVVSEEAYYNSEYGFAFRIEGLNAAGDIRDVETFIYDISDENVLYLKSSNFQRKEYSNAHQIEYVTVSDIFFEDFNIEQSN